MKTGTIKILFLIPLFCLCIGIRSGFSQNNKITVLTGSADKQVSFACDEIKKAAVDKGYVVAMSKTINARSNDKLVVKIISDSVSVIKIAMSDVLKMPEQFGWQCYSVRIKTTGDQTVI
jgi:hypothetical protein